jgi:hypothetical protein
MMDPDPVKGLEHDHVAFSAIVAQVKDSPLRPLGDVAGDLRACRLVESLRDDLLAHFAKEEEALFPFIARGLPEFAEGIERLLSGHETVCGSIVRLAHCLSNGGRPHDGAVALFERFERAYSEHARAEVVLLREVGGRLDPEQRRTLAALLDGL